MGSVAKDKRAVSAQVPKSVADDIDAQAKALGVGMTRSYVVRQLICEALDARKSAQNSAQGSSIKDAPLGEKGMEESLNLRLPAEAIAQFRVAANASGRNLRQELRFRLMCSLEGPAEAAAIKDTVIFSESDRGLLACLLGRELERIIEGADS